MLVVVGAKQFETRHWQTSFRGDLVIHAAKKRDREVLAAYENLRPVMARMGTPVQPMVFGAALCVVRLVDCIPTEIIRESLSDQERAFGNYASGRYAWQFEGVRPFAEPLPYRGQQGMWTWDLPIPGDEITHVRKVELT
jgi:hypothetical protein